MSRRPYARHCAWSRLAQMPADRPAASSPRTGLLRRSGHDRNLVAVRKPFSEDRERTDRNDYENAGIERLLRVTFQDRRLAARDHHAPVSRGRLHAESEKRDRRQVDHDIAE